VGGKKAERMKDFLVWLEEGGGSQSADVSKEVPLRDVGGGKSSTKGYVGEGLRRISLKLT